MSCAVAFKHPDITPDSVHAVLRRCVGQANGATAAQLVVAITGRTHARPTELRHFRRAIKALRTHGHAICADPTHGYFMAANAAELEHACHFLRSRAMTSLRQESVMRRIPLVDLLGQLRLPEGI